MRHIKISVVVIFGYVASCVSEIAGESKHSTIPVCLILTDNQLYQGSDAIFDTVQSGSLVDVPNSIKSVAFQDNNGVLISDNSAAIWTWSAKNRRLTLLNDSMSRLTRAANAVLSYDGQSIAFTTTIVDRNITKNTLNIANVNGSAILRAIQVDDDVPIEFSRDNSLIVTWNPRNKTLKTWGTDKGDLRGSLGGVADRTTIVLSHNGKWLFQGNVADRGGYVHQLPISHSSAIKRKTIPEQLIGERLPSITCVAISWDNKRLAVVDANGDLKIYEIASRRECFRHSLKSQSGNSVIIRRIVYSRSGLLLALGFWENDRIEIRHAGNGHLLTVFGHESKSPFRQLIFSPDNKLLVSLKDNAIVWNTSELLPTRQKVDAGQKKSRDELWEDLAGDPIVAYRAFQKFATDPVQSVSFIRNNIKLGSPQTVEQIKTLIKQLDDDSFSIRQSATKTLVEIGPAALDVLRSERDLGLVGEANQRVAAIITKIELEQLRLIRAIEILETVGSDESMRTLNELSRGHIAPLLAQEVKESMARLSARIR